jgi:mRNA (2'-O-methyladenosine-N6-)-methyltransferase
MKYLNPIISDRELLNKKRQRKSVLDLNYKEILEYSKIEDEFSGGSLEFDIENNNENEKEKDHKNGNGNLINFDTNKEKFSEKTNLFQKRSTKDSDEEVEFHKGRIIDNRKKLKLKLKLKSKNKINKLKLSKKDIKKVKFIENINIKINENLNDNDIHNSNSKKERKISYNSNDSQIYSSISKLNSDDNILEFKENINLVKIKEETKIVINESLNEIEKLKKLFFENEEKIGNEISAYDDNCIPINTDIRNFNFDFFIKKQKEFSDDNKLFDVILMDPPWQLSSSQPNRGVAISYKTLNDNIIFDIPVHKLQTDGFIFIWVINAKFKIALDLMKKWEYKYCDEIIWVKQTVNGKIAKGHGYYLQHTKETCLVGIKGNPEYTGGIMSDVIFSKRRGQSQKPEEIYNIIETLIPKGNYLELFGRRNNLRRNWVTIGDEL